MTKFFRTRVAGILAFILLLAPACPRRAGRSDFKPEADHARGGSGYGGNSADQEAARQARSPRLPPRDGETLLGVYSLNLDADTEEEQICVLKRRDDSSSFIRVTVLDQQARASWQRIWDGITLATKYPTFSVSVKDLVGEHSADLICIGMNDSGRQTMVAFKPAPRDGPKDPGYSTILAIEADSVEIAETERSDAYALGQSDAQSWAILSYEQSPESDNYLDQVETAWNWNPAKRGYEKGEERHISGSRIEQRVIERYLDGKAETFEGFLAGVWLSQEGSGSASDPATTRMVQFDSATRTIAFSESGPVSSLSVYNWKNSQPTKRGIFVSAQNQMVDSMKRFLHVDLVGSEAISIRIIDDLYYRTDLDLPWNGSYRKTTPDIEGAERARQAALKPLSGRYASSSGEAIESSTPRFAWTGPGGAGQGVFSQYALDECAVLIFKSLKSSGIIIKTQTFVIERLDRKRGGSAFEEIRLLPARTTASGVELLDRDPIVLERPL